MATALEAAIWMVEEIRSRGVLYQKDAAKTVAERFGQEFVYVNENGNLAIGERVLQHFRIMTEDEAVWVKDGFYWRMKRDSDPYGERRVGF